MSDAIGRGWAFPIQLSDSEQVALIGGREKIRQAIHLILNTALGERVMRPDFGCRIHELIFWPANQHTAALAEQYVEEALRYWEPRIRLHRVSVSPHRVHEHSDSDYAALLIEVVYQVIFDDETHMLTYTFPLQSA
ncbi:MAG: GPW/gp25 family protein [Chloroflexota bacterium]|nr:GPW/gp25 family protein [Chloroflexota bacterium]